MIRLIKNKNIRLKQNLHDVTMFETLLKYVCVGGKGGGDLDGEHL